MRIIALSTIKNFWLNPSYHEAKEPLLSWFRHVATVFWSGPADLKRDYRSASVLKDGRVVFNIAGNKYRLVVWINYSYQVVYIRFIGTHKQYDLIDAQTI
jgi:mRNA interferase HigB